MSWLDLDLGLPDEAQVCLGAGILQAALVVRSHDDRCAGGEDFFFTILDTLYVPSVDMDNQKVLSGVNLIGGIVRSSCFLAQEGLFGHMLGVRLHVAGVIDIQSNGVGGFQNDYHWIPFRFLFR